MIQSSFTVVYLKYRCVDDYTNIFSLRGFCGRRLQIKTSALERNMAFENRENIYEVLEISLQLPSLILFSVWCISFIPKYTNTLQ